jgi:Fumarylacetoacetate (FAA) hydrolase family/Domain of unknown function (DUF2437)
LKVPPWPRTTRKRCHEGARFRTAGGAPGFGIVEDDTAVELDHPVAPFDLLLTGAYAAEPTDPRLPLGEVRWEPPLGDHSKILCVGLNYAAHASESGRDTPQAPSLFVRFQDSLLGAGTPVVRPAGEDSLDWEGEVGLVIGKPGRRIAVEDSWSHVAGSIASEPGPRSKGLLTSWPSPFFQVRNSRGPLNQWPEGHLIMTLPSGPSVDCIV